LQADNCYKTLINSSPQCRPSSALQVFTPQCMS
jgi:hypothetical protein